VSDRRRHSRSCRHPRRSRPEPGLGPPLAPAARSPRGRQGPLLAASDPPLRLLCPIYPGWGLLCTLAVKPICAAGGAPARPPSPCLLSGGWSGGRGVRLRGLGTKQPRWAGRLRLRPAECRGRSSLQRSGLLLVRGLAFDGVGFRSGLGGGGRPSAQAGPGAPFSGDVARRVARWRPCARFPGLPFDGWLSELAAGWFQPVEVVATGRSRG